MEPFIVSARKYRPETFEDVVGQSAITKTLENAIERNHLAQALLFTGPRGVGKTTCARILAKKINQQSGTFNPDEDFAFNIFELDAASNNGVDDIRSIVDQVRIPPQVGSFKVYIIDEVHMLSTNAFNAFLKTLEEPPAHAIFILATTEKHKIIPTILSRCQIFDFKRITVGDMRKHLKRIAVREGIEAEEEALHIIAQKADGALRDSLSIFDRVVSFSGNTLTVAAVTENLNVLDRETYFKITDLILENNIPQLLVEYDTIIAKGFDGQHFINGLASHFRDLMVSKDARTIKLLEVGEINSKKYLEQSQKTDLSFLQQAVYKANEADNHYRNSRNPRLLVEICLMQLASITTDGEKKNDLGHILPAVYFINHVVKEPSVLKNITLQATTTHVPELLKTVPVHENDKPIHKTEEERAQIATAKTEEISKTQDALKQEDAKSLAEIEHIERELAQTKKPQPTLLDVPALILAEEDPDDYEKDEDPSIDFAFDFEIDLDKIESRQAHPAAQSGIVTHQQPALSHPTAGEGQENTAQETAASVDTQTTHELLESKKRALQNKLQERVSKYSLQGIEARNASQKQKLQTQGEDAVLPQEHFTTSQVLQLWNAYKKILVSRGSMNLVSCMNIDTPAVDGTLLKLHFPNQSMKENLESAKGEILEYLRTQLNNHLIDLSITVDEVVQKKYIYTDQDKYTTFVEKNPAVRLLQAVFNLDF